MNTSIPRLDATAPPAADPAGTDLIARLANEIFSEYHRGGFQSPALAGAPGLANGGDGGLAGAYPSVTSSIAPPVHPGVQPAATKPVHSNETPSGEHSPESDESYAFGEPRCHQRVAGQVPRGQREQDIPYRSEADEQDG